MGTLHNTGTVEWLFDHKHQGNLDYLQGNNKAPSLTTALLMSLNAKIITHNEHSTQTFEQLILIFHTLCL